VEAEYRIRVDEQRLRPQSGGAGQHRGGDGMVRSYTVLGEGLSLTTMFERRVVSPYGLQGGAPGLPFRVTLHRDGTSRELLGKENLALAVGDRVVIETSGGGGYGAA
jgi:N-methylhydantoinase B